MPTQDAGPSLATMGRQLFQRVAALQARGYWFYYDVDGEPVPLDARERVAYEVNITDPRAALGQAPDPATAPYLELYVRSAAQRAAVAARHPELARPRDLYWGDVFRFRANGLVEHTLVLDDGTRHVAGAPGGATAALPAELVAARAAEPEIERHPLRGGEAEFVSWLLSAMAGTVARPF